MAAIRTTLSPYLIPHVHPGLEMPLGTAQKGIAAARKLSQPVNIQRWNTEFRRRNFHTLDANPGEVSLGDPEKYEAVCKVASNNIHKLETLSLRGFEMLLKRLNRLILGLNTDPAYRTTMMAIFTFPDFREIWASPERFREFIRESDPSSLPWFEGFLKKENLPFAKELVRSDSLDPIQESRVLSKESKMQLKKYAALGMAPHHIPRKLQLFFQELNAKLQMESPNPFEIAAFVHMRIVQIHPFDNGNGRLARLMMNMILKKFALPPIYFYSETEYTREVVLGRQDLSSFAEFISRKVYFFQQLRKTAAQASPVIQEQNQYMQSHGCATCTWHISPLATPFLKLAEERKL